jgi:hypothetical protein
MKLTSTRIFAYSRNYCIKADVAPITFTAVVTPLASPPKQPVELEGGGCVKRRAAHPEIILHTGEQFHFCWEVIFQCMTFNLKF